MKDTKFDCQLLVGNVNKDGELNKESFGMLIHGMYCVHLIGGSCIVLNNVLNY